MFFSSILWVTVAVQCVTVLSQSYSPWPVTVITYQPVTLTLTDEVGFTTQAITTDVVISSGSNPVTSITTETKTLGYTKSIPTSTRTNSAYYVTLPVPPSAIATLDPQQPYLDSALSALSVYAPEITSVDTRSSSQLDADLSAHQTAWVTVQDYTYGYNLASAADQLHSDLSVFLASSASTANAAASTTTIYPIQVRNTVDLLLQGLYPYDITATSASSMLVSTISANPTLVSEVQVYINAAKTFYAPSVVAEASLVSRDLSTTYVGPPWLTEARSIASVLQTMTTSSSGCEATQDVLKRAAVVAGAGLFVGVVNLL